LTEAITPSIASSTATLPPVRPVISSASSSGTPGARQRGERARPARDRHLLDDRADLHRHVQAEVVPLAPPCGFLPLDEGDDHDAGHAEHRPPVAGDDFETQHRDLRERRQFPRIP
jgi:hypothetical protein